MSVLAYQPDHAANRPPMPASPARFRATALRAPAHPAAGTPRIETVAPGQSIFLHGAPAVHFFEILSGTVRCFGTTEDGRRQIYRFAGEGEMLGLGGEEHHTHAAEAVTPVRIRRYRLTSLDALMAEDEKLRGRILQALRDELATVRTQAMLLGRMSAAERIASFLRRLATRSMDSEGCILLAMTRADIADHLGLTLETVSRKINALKRLGIIELRTPCRIRIADFDRLDAMAEPA